MAYRINAFFNWFNRQNSILVLFILCMANFFGLTLEGGEEQYFGFARQYMDPSWMPHSFTLNHPAGGNLAFQVITGTLLKYISFEQMAIWGRIVNFLMYAIPLSLIIRKLKLSNVETVFILQVVFFAHQSLYAGEWIFKNFEEKTLAYIFVFWSLYFLLNNKPFASSVFAAIATWFHFLVGGWMFCFVFLYFIVRIRTIRMVLTTGVPYLVIVLPLIVYLYHTYFTDNPSVINGVNTNAIYSFWRLKHHVGMFSDPEYFITYSLWGVALTMVLFAICVFVFRKVRSAPVQQLNALICIMFGQQFLFMLLSVLDREGIVGKTYPFRTNSLSWLLFLLESALVAKIYLPRIYRRYSQSWLNNIPVTFRKLVFTNSLNLFLVFVTVPVFIAETVNTIRDLKSYHGDLDESMLSLIEYAKENSPRNAVFLFVDGDRPYSFIRRAERERFVVVKFTPTKSTTLYEWYRRAIIKERLRENISLIDSVKTAYPVQFLVSDSLYSHPSIEPEKQFGSHILYRVGK